MRRVCLLLLALTALAVPFVGPHGPHALAALASYLQAFGGAPSAPHAYRPPGWDVTVSSRDLSTWKMLQPMDAQHGPTCGAPPATHHLDGSYANAVFLCKDHIMTAINAAGYGVIYLTPNQLADWSGGEAVVRWDMSTLRTSSRDWIDLWISPYDDHLQLPLEHDLPSLDGEPRAAIHVRMDNAGSGTMFRVSVIRDFKNQPVAGKTERAYETFLTPDAARRDTFELRISRTHLKFGMPGYNFAWTDADIPDLGWDSGVVQFGHHSYNPTKLCQPGRTCTANTWHWDNVSITPAVPFAITAADQPFVDQTTPPNVTFPTGAPADAHLRFDAQATNLRVSFDNGRTWRPARVQPAATPHGDHFQSYWMPIPAGTKAVRIAGRGGYWGRQWIARDISIWGPPGK